MLSWVRSLARWIWAHIRYLSMAHAMSPVWTSFFLLLAVRWEKWALLFFYAAGLIPVVGFCFLVLRDHHFFGDMTRAADAVLVAKRLFDTALCLEPRRWMRRAVGGLTRRRKDGPLQPPGPDCPTPTAYSREIECEVEKFVNLIMRDFVQTWYKVVACDPDIVEELHERLHALLRETCSRLQALDHRAVARDLTVMYREHLTKFQSASAALKLQRYPRPRRPGHAASISSVQAAFELKFSLHVATKSDSASARYVRELVELVMACLDSFPAELSKSRSVKKILVEIFTSEVASPLLEMLSSPEFLHECIITLLSDKKGEEEATTGSSSPVVDADDHSPLYELDPPPKILLDVRIPGRPGCEVIGGHPIYRERIPTKRASVPKDFKMPDCSSSEEGLDLKGSPVLSSSFVFTRSEKDNHGTGYSLKYVQDLTKEGLNSLGLKITGGDLSQNFCNRDSQSGRKDVGRILYKTEDLAGVGFTEGSNDDFNHVEKLAIHPRIFQDVCVVSTEATRESRSSLLYTLYGIQYDALYLSSSGEFSVKSGQVKRRFREFLNLQSRLEENNVYKRSLKGVKGPKRWLSFPFGNLDQDNVSQRKRFLDRYLKSLIEVDDICNGPELKEFLAHDGDGHIAFVRKAPEINMPRIDKAFVRTVSGVFDKLVMALPSLPQDVLPGLSNKKDGVHTVKQGSIGGQEDKIIEDADQLLIDLKAVSEEHCTVTTTSGLREFLNSVNTSPDLLAEKLPDKSEISIVDWQDAMMRYIPRSQGDGCDSPDKFKCPKTRPISFQPDLGLSASVLDLVVQALQGCDCWISQEATLKIIKAMFGKTFDNWLHKEMTKLSSIDQCLHYLQLLREKIWPNGKLATDIQLHMTADEKETKRKLARETFREFFPRILVLAIGEDNFEHGVDQVLAVIQYQQLNNFLDMLIVKMFPEVTYPDFQEKLLSEFL